MKKLKLFIFLTTYSLLLTTFISPIFAQTKSYYYDSIEVIININKDGTFDVAEKQCFNFTGNFHYAYREIALRRLKKIDHISVIDEKTGQPLIQGKNLNKDNPNDWGKFEVKKENNRAKVTWFFNLTDTNYCWTVKYKVHGGIGFFNDHDELYWNAIFSERTVKVEKAKVVVILPESLDRTKVPSNKIQTLYTSDGVQNEKYEMIDDKTYLWTAENLLPYSEFTIVAGWQKGMIQESLIHKILRNITFVGWLIPIIVFIFMFRLYWLKGRDAGRKEPIAPEFAPPSRSEKTTDPTIPPAYAEVLMKEKATINGIIATIIDLARRGYLKIIEKEDNEYIFLREKSPDDLVGFEKEVFIALFSREPVALFSRELVDKVSTENLRNKFYLSIPFITEKIEQEVDNLGYFYQNPTEVRKIYLKKSFIFLGLGIFFGFLTINEPLYLNFTLGFGLSWIIASIISYFMPARTLLGRKKLNQWLGFKLYLTKTERFGYSDNVTQEVFEEYLPYAVMMGVADKWAKRFADLQFKQPDWYVGTASLMSFSDFSSSFSEMVTSVSSTFTSSPSSSSGFDGGGGAGGGSGGGGGGAG